MTTTARALLLATAMSVVAAEYEYKEFSNKDCSGDGLTVWSWPSGQGHECVPGKFLPDEDWYPDKEKKKARIHFGCAKESDRIPGVGDKKRSNLLYFEVWDTDEVGQNCERDAWKVSTPLMFMSDELSQRFLRGECVTLGHVAFDYSNDYSIRLSTPLEKGDYPTCDEVEISLGVVGGGSAFLGICVGAAVAYALFMLRKSKDAPADNNVGVATKA